MPFCMRTRKISRVVDVHDRVRGAVDVDGTGPLVGGGYEVDGIAPRGQTRDYPCRRERSAVRRVWYVQGRGRRIRPR